MPTTAPVYVHQWTSSEWTTLITCAITLVSGVLITAIVNAILKIMDFRTKSRIAIIEAESKAAAITAAGLQGRIDELSERVTGIGRQASLALASGPAPTPAKAADFLKS